MRAGLLRQRIGRRLGRVKLIERTGTGQKRNGDGEIVQMLIEKQCSRQIEPTSWARSMSAHATFGGREWRT